MFLQRAYANVHMEVQLISIIRPALLGRQDAAAANAQQAQRAILSGKQASFTTLQTRYARALLESTSTRALNTKFASIHPLAIVSARETQASLMYYARLK